MNSPPQNGCLAQSRGIGEQLAPPLLSPKTHCSAAGCSPAHVYFKEGARQLLISVCTSGGCPMSSCWLPAPHLPAPAHPAARGRAGCPLEEREQSRPARLAAPLEYKSRTSRVHFRLFYRSHQTARPCRAEPALGRASLLWGEAGPPGHGQWSSPERRWKSKAEQAQHRTGGASRQGPALSL